MLGCGPVCLWGNEGPSVRGRQTVSSTVIFVVDLCLNRKDVEEMKLSLKLAVESLPADTQVSKRPIRCHTSDRSV